MYVPATPKGTVSLLLSPTFWILQFLLICPLSILQAFQPVVDLGSDTVSCGTPVILDAGNAGSTFLWSTGAVTQTISAETSGTYWVDVTDGTGTSRDSIEVQILTIPPAPVLEDKSVCNGETADYTVANESDGVLWYDSPTDGNLLSVGGAYSAQPEGSTSIYASRFNYGPARIGMSDTTFGTISYIVSNGNGEIFDVLSQVRINAVYTYANAPMTFTLTIENAQGQVLYSQNVSVPEAYKRTRIPIDFELTQGTDYKMLARNITGNGGLVLSFPSSLSHPYTIEDVISITKSVSVHPPNRFFYFFDWEIDIPTCFSDRAASQITLLPTPEVNLGSDTILCADTGLPFTLDATYPDAAYLWSDGSTNPTFNVTETDTITVLANIGNCLASDEIEVFVFDTPMQSNLADTSICGPQELLLTESLDPLPNQTLWWDDAGGLLHVGQNYTSFFGSSTHLSVQSMNSPNYRIGAADRSITPTIIRGSLSDRGMQIDVHQDLIIKSAVIYPASISITEFDIVLRDSNNIELKRIPQRLIPPFGEELIQLDLFVPKGNRYSLGVENLSGGPLDWNFTDLDDPVFPMVLDNIATITSGISSGTLTTRQYNHFYDMQVIPYTSACKSTPKEIEVQVKLPLALTDSIYNCSEFVLSASIDANTYSWNTGATSQGINVTETGTYVLTVDDGAGCQVIDSSFVEIPTSTGLPEDGILCGNVIHTNYESPSTFLWSTGSTNSSIEINSPGTYGVQITEPRGCVLEDSVVISGFDSFPTVNLGEDQTACEMATLDAGNAGLSYLWSTGEFTQTIDISASGLYSVIVSNANNCPGYDTIGVSITPNPVARFSIPDTVIGGVNRRVNFVNQSSFGSYKWDFGDGNTSSLVSPSHTYADTGSYCVDLIVNDLQNNCGSDTTTMCILVLQYPVGIEDGLFPTQITLLPNPVRETLFLQFEDPLPGSTEIFLYDMQGSLLKSASSQIRQSGHVENLDVRDFSPGMYLLRLDHGRHLLYQKFIIQP